MAPRTAARDDGIQVLMATHSPILTATPGARICRKNAFLLSWSKYDQGISL